MMRAVLTPTGVAMAEAALAQNWTDGRNVILANSPWMLLLVAFERAFEGQYFQAGGAFLLCLVALGIAIYWKAFEGLGKPSGRRRLAFILISIGVAFLAVGIYLLAAQKPLDHQVIVHEPPTAEDIAKATAPLKTQITQLQASLDDMTRQKDNAVRQQDTSKARLAGRNENDIRRIQDRVQEICEYLNTKKLALAQLDNFTKFSVDFVVSRGKARALQSADDDRKNVADLYSEVAGGFPSRFRVDWGELASIISGGEGIVGSVSGQIDSYRGTLARINEPPTTQNVDELLNAVRPLQTSVPALQQWLNNSFEKCLAKKADLERTPLNAN